VASAQAEVEVAVEEAPAAEVTLEVQTAETAAPVEIVVPVEVAAVEVAPVEATSVEVRPVEVAPAEVAAVEVTPVEVATTEAVAVDVAAEAPAVEAAAPAADTPAPVEAAASVETPPAAVAPVAATAAETPAAVETETSSRKTVMIVDDSPTIRKILGLTLERAGYKVVPEPDGESALERLTKVVPDVILLDIAMPKVDGYEVCKRIKKDTRVAHVPVVMLSGKDALFDKVKGRMAGATEYLTKPFQTPAVLAAVAQACQPAAAETVNG
jgi:twitching motility two-component system response regulator PilG